MKICEILDQSKNPFVSFEIIPPARGKSAREIYQIIDELIEFRPPFIDVTSHAADSYFVEQADGTFSRHIKRKRPGTIGLCAAIKYRYRLEAVPHLLCQGFTRQETEDALIELNYLGIDNLLAVRGDDVQYKKAHLPGRQVNEHSLDLIKQIADMNHGKYLEDIEDAEASDFCIGVGGYPEKHPESPSKAADIRYLKQKVDAGAQYIVTQMFFNNQDFYNFVDQCRAVGINIPIIPGLKLLTQKHQLKSLPRSFATEIPDDLVTAIETASDAQERNEIGIKHAIMQCEDLLNNGFNNLHFFVIKDVQNVKKVIQSLNIV
ncbi:MAG: methylenetetrahydrofolate reductase [Candidatus Marinimicrobia bacterium]|nr:methylenetetrahydrofolate reductase [Candidatus Neomarinimicrobiota bacterium]